ncbi:hypothetical protein BABINDRAFT_145818 [Babjeviella inositovora NRRL Y-12698]|uniref:Uncharacterized protein n=1 Tax=Babjeviella inositovora NRRL Y-12698 TaxID=984486 RepID=A0A1E3QRR8_9ASCO|nr:uncharacterized protein BABINDRAFT_145818 [Babjeviella inositovora NRRL Y-12698]ODQ79637.1 hypothetical protein BABINDRAFT_145818 [Babjeviella inositovora NRRL Y-12698]
MDIIDPAASGPGYDPIPKDLAEEDTEDLTDASSDEGIAGEEQKNDADEDMHTDDDTAPAIPVNALPATGSFKSSRTNTTDEEKSSDTYDDTFITSCLERITVFENQPFNRDTLHQILSAVKDTLVQLRRVVNRANFQHYIGHHLISSNQERHEIETRLLQSEIRFLKRFQTADQLRALNSLKQEIAHLSERNQHLSRLVHKYQYRGKVLKLRLIEKTNELALLTQLLPTQSSFVVSKPYQPSYTDHNVQPTDSMDYGRATSNLSHERSHPYQLGEKRRKNSGRRLSAGDSSNGLDALGMLASRVLSEGEVSEVSEAKVSGANQISHVTHANPGSHAKYSTQAKQGSHVHQSSDGNPTNEDESVNEGGPVDKSESVNEDGAVDKSELVSEAEPVNEVNSASHTSQRKLHYRAPRREIKLQKDHVLPELIAVPLSEDGSRHGLASELEKSVENSRPAKKPRPLNCPRSVEHPSVDAILKHSKDTSPAVLPPLYGSASHPPLLSVSPLAKAAPSMSRIDENRTMDMDMDETIMEPHTSVITSS